MKRSLLLLALPLILGVPACSGMKKTLGMEKSAPDEFAVVERAPLTVPPNFNLMPPQPGAKPRHEAHTSDTAQGLVLGSQSSAPKAQRSASENALLSKAGPSDAAIRKELDDNADEDMDDATVAQKIGISSGKSGKALDPSTESKRLQGAKIKTPTVPAKNAQ